MEHTKKELITLIEDALQVSGKEIVVADFNRFRNGRWGFHGYCICWIEDGVYVRPWSGAARYWRAKLDTLNKTELIRLWDRI